MAGKKKAHVAVIWEKAYISALSQTGNWSLAAQMASVDRKTARMRYLTYPPFREACDDAMEMGVDILEAEARRRAMAGSDVLLIFLLKAHRPEKFRDQYHVQTTSTPTDYVIDLSAPSESAALYADPTPAEVLE